MILDEDMDYLGEFGGNGDAPGQFNGIHAIAVGPGGRIFALDRSGVGSTFSGPQVIRPVCSMRRHGMDSRYR